MSTSYKSLQIAVALTGVACISLYPLAVVWPAGWVWESGAPYQSHLFMMIVGVYATLGVFLLKAARDPQANLSLIWFTAIRAWCTPRSWRCKRSVAADNTWVIWWETFRRCSSWASRWRCLYG